MKRIEYVAQRILMVLPSKHTQEMLFWAAMYWLFCYLAIEGLP